MAALDTYIHGVLLDYSVDILCGSRPGTSAARIGLPFNVVAELIGAKDKTTLHLTAISYVAQRLAKETFQRPDSIAQGLSAVGVERVWSKAFGSGAGKITEALGLIVYRRNQIVHACDVDPTSPFTLLPLTSGDAIAAAKTVDAVVRGIHGIL
ncbi:hypothetical protein F8279_12335 [Micromonospora sp. AMSO1212t]|uniref:hypothetical protein n=1 Tax=Micromonospora sp. AMSO1212t TaxID=2650565 RepID=UPI00130AD9EC|nr:hypothetical protein [Micromonospora sp. AMSO1212t]KAB1906984.1 hypothetical protein F8279_12335 [Micromonospora sp. AMSO1212t]